ncbi:MAG: putative tRNA threonylcarbamoyladenosine biosynthesis protein Gcp [Candidatus Jorgensenbacteria bacterium GW2011_GWA1_48_13]|uniref:tRNA N6-adenosine threonylcarbamoyltransferase n=2 Tax=Candidatus Joergenseniibacteriota TaxID=1752739 RepID=A0A0G1YIH4_9BACT|nr:MAG: putative tRNA threonylcarbamoyladenosine biosynthesis protein Gcp [Candidatus Jorgensenbacteria bacterium GW2011_GWA1_48_13]KKU98684.1 MAG: O-sialoglycoprotein endopeptidase, O-sialoglycoprotein endopeptidase [Candidatus Jorgensenbacteria bacterium GW2011_GWC1_48_8]KKW14762.1 MAG: putative tRNA threonylcarbamoyladenosine biosynthesis protein Gcp [Candidatus Jorgensenbacteria bacterium GW2011_GWB1_50_10]
MRILAIETSCDETAMALVEASGGLNAPRFKVLKNIISSQIEIHRPFGGVVPNLAKREHIRNLPIIFKKLKPTTYNLKPDLIAVTVGPGLEPALWTGVNFAKEIRKSNFPKANLVGANHLEGHLYSFLLSKKYDSKPKNIFPAISLVVSGGHTILVMMKSLTNWRKLGETRDDAVGETFDKVARMLNFPYPGGPEIEKLAKKGNPNAVDFPRPMINQKNYDFSFSGLKTSVLYYLRDNPKTKKADVAASFQKAAIDTLVAKTLLAAKEYKAKSIMLSGGVAANKALRKSLKAESYKLKANFLVAPLKFNTDNAVMIAVASYIQHLQKKNRAIRAQANLNL